jgi:hypothetical protein
LAAGDEAALATISAPNMQMVSSKFFMDTI